MQRTEHFYFAVGTLGLQNIVIVIVLEVEGLHARRPAARRSNIRPLSIFGTKFDTEFRVFEFLVVSLAILMVIAAFIERSPVRREAIANRDQTGRVRTLGLPTLVNPHHDVHARFVLRRARRIVLRTPVVLGHARELRCRTRVCSCS